MFWLVLSVLPRLTWLGYPARQTCLDWPVPALLSQGSCPRCLLSCSGHPAPCFVSFPGCTILTPVSTGCLVLSRLSCPICSSQLPAPWLLSPAYLSQESSFCCYVLASRPNCPVMAFLSSLTFQDDLFRLTSPGCPIQRDSSWHVPDVIPQIYCHGIPAMYSCHISVFLSQLPCPSVLFWPSCLLFLVLPVPSWMPSLAVLSWLSFPSI